MPEAQKLFFKSSERKWILLLCILAAAHVFIYSAAFPFFNNVDEPVHFDLIVKYSHGHIPRGLETFSAESSAYLSTYSSLAYLGTAETLPDKQFPSPPWTQPVEKMRRDLAMNAAAWQKQENYEASEPPLYYALAGLWWRAGNFFGFSGGDFLYSLRFLNIFFVIALVWIGHLAARTFFPQNYFLRLGVPALLAFMPQSEFYSMGNDVLSAVFFGVAFICLLKLLNSENPNARLGIILGLSLAATFLTKMTNLPLIAIAFIIVLLKIRRLMETKKLCAALPSFIALFLCAAPPMLIWMIVSKNHFGDFLGGKLKMAYFGWTYKPFDEWWHHPIFSPHGIWIYLLGQWSTFWQGEFFWHDRPMDLPLLNTFYTVISLLLPAFAFAGFFRRSATVIQREAISLSFICIAIDLAFYAFLSIIYDFGNCINPSRAFPYFHAGRMILGALIPFLLLFIYGMDRALNRFGNAVKFSALWAFILFMLISEIVTDWRVFSSPYNWFHL